MINAGGNQIGKHDYTAERYTQYRLFFLRVLGERAEKTLPGPRMRVRLAHANYPRFDPGFIVRQFNASMCRIGDAIGSVWWKWRDIGPLLDVVKTKGAGIAD
ncbi:hypothetical protein ACFSHT_15565 [Paraburkholderia silviterrae]|uniref:hypothetical protein n=1 Tax=Paraburkholderia silviterrae TaxID=2528715 RepID=UPI003635E3CC